MFVDITFGGSMNGKNDLLSLDKMNYKKWKHKQYLNKTWNWSHRRMTHDWYTRGIRSLLTCSHLHPHALGEGTYLYGKVKLISLWKWLHAGIKLWFLGIINNSVLPFHQYSAFPLFTFLLSYYGKQQFGGLKFLPLPKFLVVSLIRVILWNNSLRCDTFFYTVGYLFNGAKMCYIFFYVALV